MKTAGNKDAASSPAAPDTDGLEGCFSPVDAAFGCFLFALIFVSLLACVGSYTVARNLVSWLGG